MSITRSVWLLLGGLALIGCATTFTSQRASARVYAFQQPVIETGDQPLAIKDADWTACDRKADQLATLWYVNRKNFGAKMAAGMGGAIGIGIAAASGIYDDDNPNGTESDAERTRRDKNYEDKMRQCLKKRGYALDAPQEDDPAQVRYR